MSLQAKRFKKKQNSNRTALHARNQQHHTYERFWRHYGIKITQNEYFSLIDQIQSRRSIFVRMITKRLKNHIVELRNQIFMVGYDKKTKQIATVLPLERLYELQEVCVA